MTVIPFVLAYLALHSLDSISSVPSKMPGCTFTCAHSLGKASTDMEQTRMHGVVGTVERNWQLIKRSK